MSYYCGTDIIEVDRVKKAILSTPGFKEKIFTPLEIEYADKKSDVTRFVHYAGRFAAKEAFSKALGTGITGFNLKDVFVQNDENGRPFLVVQNKASEILKNKFGECNIHISLSHEKEFAIAFVVIES